MLKMPLALAVLEAATALTSGEPLPFIFWGRCIPDEYPFGWPLIVISRACALSSSSFSVILSTRTRIMVSFGCSGCGPGFLEATNASPPMCSYRLLVDFTDFKFSYGCFERSFSFHDFKVSFTKWGSRLRHLKRGCLSCYDNFVPSSFRRPYGGSGVSHFRGRRFSMFDYTSSRSFKIARRTASAWLILYFLQYWSSIFFVSISILAVTRLILGLSVGRPILADNFSPPIFG